MKKAKKLIGRVFKTIHQTIHKYKLDALLDVFLFIIITLIIHYGYRYWANPLNYIPLTDFIMGGQKWLSGLLYSQSVWIVDHLFGISFTGVEQNKTLYFPNNGFIAVNMSCSGFKQILQFVLLMAVYPGPWKQKLWFIPMGIIIVHLTNIFRITGLSVVIVNWPQYWDFSHDNLFRPFFYVVIFSLWVLWVEKIMNSGKQKKAV
ncbi:MAG: exosortase/archaeosortase family protein [Bacteroidales bacterium]|nr:exosortase/archaeosortase family protein [Bacteroidales bacterium]